jgi:ketosteroid isomerase-like protein
MADAGYASERSVSGPISVDPRRRIAVPHRRLELIVAQEFPGIPVGEQMSSEQMGTAAPVPYELYIDFDALARLWRAEEPTWPDRTVVACAFQAAELNLRLLDGALDETREVAFGARRIDRLVEVLLDGFRATAELLDGSPPPNGCTLPSPPARPSPGLAVLDRLDRCTIRQVTDGYFTAFGGLPLRLGPEAQLNTARERAGLPTMPQSPAPVLDYGAVVRPQSVHQLPKDPPHGPEDVLFRTVHQITECWLRVAHHFLRDGHEAARAGCWPAAARQLDLVSRVLQVVIQVGQLLDLMTLADYHPLRVRLRDGSGAQSRAAQRLRPAARAALSPLLAELHRRDVGVVAVLDRPADHVDVYRYLCALKTFGKRYQAFLFHHYLLVLGVLGTETRGSLGYQTREMVVRAAQPVFPEIDQAHHDYAVLTNFRHGTASGSIITAKEIAAGNDPYTVAGEPRGCPPEVIRQRVDDYFRFIQERDAEAWVALFDPDRGQFCDAEGSRPYLGTRRLRVFIDTMLATFSAMRTGYSRLRVNANHAQADWHFETVSYRGTPVTFSGTETFLFTDDGRILRAAAIWQPDHVARQLWPVVARPPAAPTAAPVSWDSGS